MQCCVDDCERTATYKSAKLCQKHYFRKRRGGTTELREKLAARDRSVTPNGYVRIYRPDHPLGHKNYVFEHRSVMWDALGAECSSCELCEKPQSWKTCHIDHIDENRHNNSRDNLRVLCRGCNVKRGFKPESYSTRSKNGLIEFEGRRDTAASWARDPRVMVAGHTILRRKASGMSDFDALFSKKITHNSEEKLAMQKTCAGNLS